MDYRDYEKAARRRHREETLVLVVVALSFAAPLLADVVVFILKQLRLG